MTAFDYVVNDEPQTTTDHELAAEAILRMAGFDPASHYLVEVQGHDQVSYQTNPQAEIHIHEHAKFLAVSTEPTPVSGA